MVNHHTLVIQTFHFQNDRSGRPVLTLSLQDKGEENTVFVGQKILKN